MHEKNLVSGESAFAKKTTKVLRYNKRRRFGCTSVLFIFPSLCHYRLNSQKTDALKHLAPQRSVPISRGGTSNQRYGQHSVNFFLIHQIKIKGWRSLDKCPDRFEFCSRVEVQAIGRELSVGISLVPTGEKNVDDTVTNFHIFAVDSCCTHRVTVTTCINFQCVSFLHGQDHNALLAMHGPFLATVSWLPFAFAFPQKEK
eukprot:g77383.t1